MRTPTAWPSFLPSMDVLSAHIAAGTRLPDVSSATLQAQRAALMTWLREDPARLGMLRPVADALPKNLADHVGAAVTNLDGDAPVELVEEALTAENLPWTRAATHARTAEASSGAPRTGGDKPGRGTKRSM